jgi:hypothetical protein
VSAGAAASDAARARAHAHAGGKAGHAKYVCYVCKQQAPDLKSMGMHFDSKHPKETMDEAKFVNTHEIYGGTTLGIAVKGTLKKAKRRDKNGKEIDSDEE